MVWRFRFKVKQIQTRFAIKRFPRFLIERKKRFGFQHDRNLLQKHFFLKFQVIKYHFVMNSSLLHFFI